MKMPFRYGCVVDGEYFCPRPELERQLRNYAESGQNLVIQGERRMGKTSLVKKALAVVFAREKNGFENAIADLTPNQLTVLRGLAQMESARVFTSEFMDSVRITSPGAVKRALNSLVASRLIYQNRTAYKFSNPFFREWLKANA